MPVEIEAKIKVSDLNEIRQRLQQLQAVRVGELVETDTFFDTEDRSLLAADRGLRLRRLQEMDSSSESRFVITYKGPRKHGEIKSRDELEISIGDERDMGALLECLGYRRVLTFEKRRESWTLEGCKIELDKLPHLGVFVEIEGPNEEIIQHLRDRLQLSDRPIVKASYIAMLMTHLQETGSAERNVTFEQA